MKYTLEQKAQIMLIQNDNARVTQYGDYVLIISGYYGYYIKSKDCIIDVNRFKHLENDLSPETIKAKTVPAEKTRNVILMHNGKMAIKIKAKDGKKAWLNVEYLKLFESIITISLRIENETSPVYVSDYRGFPLGIICPVRVNSEVEE